MNRIVVPQQTLERPLVGGDRPTQAEGAWEGVLEEVRVRPFPDFVDPETRPTAGYATRDGEVLSLQFGSQEPLEGQEGYGDRKFCYDVVVRDGELTAESVDVTEKRARYWQLQRGAQGLAHLANALGAIEFTEDDNGTAVAAVAEDFRQRLEAGEFNGTRVGYVLNHRNWTQKDKTTGAVLKEGTEVRVLEFRPAI